MCREGGGLLIKKSVAIQVDNCASTIALLHFLALFKLASNMCRAWNCDIPYMLYNSVVTAKKTVGNAEKYSNCGRFFFQLEGVQHAEKGLSVQVHLPPRRWEAQSPFGSLHVRDGLSGCCDTIKT